MKIITKDYKDDEGFEIPEGTNIIESEIELCKGINTREYNIYINIIDKIKAEKYIINCYKNNLQRLKEKISGIEKLKELTWTEWQQYITTMFPDIEELQMYLFNKYYTPKPKIENYLKAKLFKNDCIKKHLEEYNG